MGQAAGSAGPRSFENADLDGTDTPYRRLIDAITDYAIYGMDAAGTITSWNTGAQRLKGYAPDEVIGRSFARFYTAEDQAAGRPQEAIATAKLDGRFESEGWRVRKDGSRFWAHVVIDPIRAPSGEAVGFAKITRDLTERREAETALATSHEHFRLLVQGVSDLAIYMLDLKGRVTNWNLGAERIKGYRPDEIIGQHFSRFYLAGDRDAGLPELGLSRALQEGRFETDGWRVRKDGSRFWATVLIQPIRDERGETVGFAKITRDITERRTNEEALESTREALAQARKMEAIGQLTGGIAHDFNNLLMAIQASLEFVKARTPPDPRVTPFLDNAMHATRRGVTLTRRMLAFARRQELRRESVDVGDLISGLMSLIRGTFDPAVVVDVHLPPDLLSVETDAAQLESSLLSLALNARDAMPQGGRLTVAAETIDHPGGPGLPPGTYVRIRVSDTGEGMTPDTLARAVEPFFTTKGVGKGTGLGLSMVHGLAAQFGGKLELTSQEGHGTSADLWLPASAPRRVPAPMAPMPDRDPARSLALVILAVDDDPLVLFNTIAMLQDQGHQTLSASSGGEALQLLESARHVDLVISDQAMPNMTGLQLALALRNRRPDLPVILATGYSELPASDGEPLITLNKPFGSVELAQAIADAVCSRAAPD